MSRKKKIYLAFGSVFLVIYLVLIFFFIHIKLVMYERPDLNISDAINAGMKDVLIQPFAIFPLAPGTVTTITVLFP